MTVTPAYRRVSNILHHTGQLTVCETSKCPNRIECFNSGTATFQILGDVCTRDCRYCAIPTGVPTQPDDREPTRIARIAGRLSLKHVVVTSVTRDDLPDGGADHFVQTIQEIRKADPAMTVEVLIPDFSGDSEPLFRVVDEAPEVIAHNVETVPRLYARVRPRADFARSCALLEAVKKRRGDVMTKSGFMLGLGERDEEVHELLQKLHDVSCDIVTIGQYLAPTKTHMEVSRYVEPEEFDQWRMKAERIGFKHVFAGVFQRSSLYAGSVFSEPHGRLEWSGTMEKAYEFDVTITCRHEGCHPNFRDEIVGSIQKLSRFHHNIIDSDVKLDKQGSENKVEIILNIPGHQITAAAKDFSQTKAFDTALEKAKTQIKKFKSKISKHRAAPAEMVSVVESGEAEPEDEYEDVEYMSED